MGSILCWPRPQKMYSDSLLGGMLESNNVAIAFSPQYVPPYPGQPSPTATPPSQYPGCPTDGRSGVYFYSVHDYQPPCAFSDDDIPDFGATNVGND